MGHNPFVISGKAIRVVKLVRVVQIPNAGMRKLKLHKNKTG